MTQKPAQEVKRPEPARGTRLPPAGEIRGLLFDLDGVLTDSMPLHALAWKRAFAERGVTITREEVYEREGEPGEKTILDLLGAQGVHPSEQEVAEILSKKEELFKGFSDVPFFPGAAEIVATLHRRGRRLGLVTGTSIGEVERILPRSFLGLFAAVITGDRVEKGKPDPEPYRRALRGIGIEAAAAVAVENAPNGIRSAKGAGIACVAISTSFPAELLHLADRVFDDHAELRAWLLPEGQGAEGPAGCP